MVFLLSRSIIGTQEFIQGSLGQARFFLIAEWADIDEHARIRKILANELKPEFIKYIEGGTFIPKYVEVVSSTPDEILNKAAAAE